MIKNSPTMYIKLHPLKHAIFDAETDKHKVLAKPNEIKVTHEDNKFYYYECGEKREFKRKVFKSQVTISDVRFEI